MLASGQDWPCVRQNSRPWTFSSETKVLADLAKPLSILAGTLMALYLMTLTEYLLNTQEGALALGHRLSSGTLK